MTIKLSVLILVVSTLCSTVTVGQNQFDHLDFTDDALENELVYPDWFKLSLGDLNDDLKSAVKNGKIGIIVYYGQKRCAYCEKFLEIIEKSESIKKFLRDHYDVIPVDIWGVDEITDTDGKTYSEYELSAHYKTTFTPSLVFYDAEGTPVFRLRGYHPPYNLMAALKYSVEKFYKQENFRDYLGRAIPGVFFKNGDLNERDFFISEPYNLKKTLKESSKPLAVFFEQGKCHACDVLHTNPLNETQTLQEIKKMSSIQLDMWSDTPLITPDGKKSNAEKWANELGLFYAPTIIFFDTSGKEILRLDSVVKFYRLLGVLSYINSKGYIKEPNYQKWRLNSRKTQ